MSGARQGPLSCKKILPFSFPDFIPTSNVTCLMGLSCGLVEMRIGGSLRDLASKVRVAGIALTLPKFKSKVVRS